MKHTPHTTLQKGLLLIAILMITHMGFAQGLSWAFSMGSINNDYGNGITTDTAGNVYVIGDYTGSMDADPGPGITTLPAPINQNMFVAKYTASGNLLWAKAIGNSPFITAKNLAVDQSGNVYITGIFNGTIDFDPGPGVYTLMDGQGSTSSFICKLNASGDFVWVKQPQAASTSAEITAMKLDHSGHIVTTGTFSGTVDFDPGAGTVEQTYDPDHYTFIWTLDTAGNYYQVQLTGYTVAAITLDAMDNLYITGQFIHTVDFDPGPGTFTLTAPGNATDMFALKLNSSGVFQWALHTTEATLDDVTFPHCITTDQSGHIYIGGSYEGTTDFDPGSGESIHTSSPYRLDMFILKLDADGTFMWAKQMGGPWDEWISAIIVDAHDKVYITGSFTNNVDFDPDGGTYIREGGGDNMLNAFVGKYDMDGSFIWVRDIETKDLEKLSHANAITIDNEENILSIGLFEGTATIRSGGGPKTIVTEGLYDVYIWKQNTCGVFVNAQTPNLSVEEGDNATLWISSNQATSIQWQQDTGTGFANLTNTSSYSGVHLDTLLITAAPLLLDQSKYRCIITNGTCSDTSDIITVAVITTTGIEEWKNAASIRVYPNPATHEFIIQSTVKDASYTLVNVVGVCVAKGKLQASSTPVDISALPPGIYMLQISNTVHKIIKAE